MSPTDVAQTGLLLYRLHLEGLVQAKHDRLKAEITMSVERPKATIVTEPVLECIFILEQKGIGVFGFAFSNA